MSWFKRKKTTAADTQNMVTKAINVVVVRVTSSGDMIDFKIGDDTELQDALSKSVWAFAAIQRNVQALCGVTPEIQRYSGRWVTDGGNSDLRKLITYPAGRSRLPVRSWADWLEIVLLQLYVFGRTYLDTRAGVLTPLKKPRSVEPQWDKSGNLTGWKYGRTKYAPEDLVELHVAGADSYFGGLSPYEAATQAIVTEATAAERARYNLENRVAPGLIFRIPESWLEDDRREEMTKWLVEQYQTASSTGTPMVLSSDSDVTAPPDYKAMTEELFGSAKNSRESIFAVFGTPPPVLGIYDQATLSNFEKSYKIWWEAILLPMYSHIMNQLNVQYIHPRFGDDVRLWYGLENTEIGIIRQSARADLAKKYVDIGYPGNIAAREAGLTMPQVPDLDVANVPWVTAGRTTPEGNPKGEK